MRESARQIAPALAPLVWPEGGPRRIVLLHLDSLCCLPALDYLFSVLGNRIGAVVSSDRFGGPGGGFWRQLRRNISHSGVRLTVALGFDIVALRIAAIFAGPIRFIFRRRRSLRTLREHAVRVGASYIVSNNINGPESLALLGRFQPDLVVSFHFDQIMRAPFFDAIPAPVLNVHPALLPAHRGPCPSFWVLQAGEQRSGVTIHRVIDASIDVGEPVARTEQAVPGWASMAELDGILFEEGARLLVTLLSTSSERLVSSDCADGYESFPHVSVVRAARRRGTRLWRLDYAVRSILNLFGFAVRDSAVSAP